MTETVRSPLVSRRLDPTAPPGRASRGAGRRAAPSSVRRRLAARHRRALVRHTVRPGLPVAGVPPRPGDRPRVLLAISNTGFGHLSAARAVVAAIEHAEVAVEPVIFDVYSEIEAPLLRQAPGAYSYVTRNACSLFNGLYSATDRSRLSARKLVALLDRIVGERLAEYLRVCRPDVVIVCNPFYMGEIFARARERTGLQFDIATLVTDPVTIHRSWFSEGVDTHFVFDGDRSAPAGPLPRTPISFPVHPAFHLAGCSRADARRQLGLAPDRPVVLVTAGGAGSGRFETVLDIAARSTGCTFVFAPGSNQALRKRIQGYGLPHLQLLRRSASLNLPMRASSLVISKAGPGTIFEAAAVGVPLLLFDEVGRQERGNIALAARFGMLASPGSDPFADGPRAVRGLLEQLEQRPAQPRPDLTAGALEVAGWIRQNA